MEKELNNIITECLGGPGGDPEQCNYVAASIAFKLLKKHNLAVDDEKDTRISLEGENVYEENFLQGWVDQEEEDNLDQDA